MIDYPITRIEKEDLSYFQTVDDVLGRSLSAGDPMIAIEFIRSLQREGFVRGLAVTKLLYRMKQSWDLFRIAGTDDEFENVIESTLGYARATVNKYINMWESVFENPSLTEETRQQLMGKPIETLLLLTAAAREDSLTSDDWDRIALAADKDEVRDVIKKRRGEQTSSKNAVRFSIYFRARPERPVGTVIMTKQGEQKVLGKLELDTDDSDVRAGVEKIINALHMFEVY